MNKKRQQKTSSPLFNLAQYERKPYFLPALGLCGLLMGILLFDANLSLTGDNAQFINLGRSLADGHGLSETIEGEPIPHTKYPFGFPLLLAITHIIFPDNLIALKSLIVLLYAISIPLTYLLIRRFAPPPIALGVSALCLASSLLLDYSHQIMSEIPFLLFSLMALLLLHRAQKSSTLSTLAPAIIAIIAAYYIRSAGIILIGTGILFFTLHKKWKEAGLIAAGSLLLALPWQIRNASLGSIPYINQLLSVNPYRPEEGMLTLTTLIERIIANLDLYGLLVIPYILLPSSIDTNYFGVGLVFSGLILYALISGLIKRHLLIVYLTCYLSLYILWPHVCGPTRAFSSRSSPSSSTPSSPAWTNCSTFSPEHLKKTASSHGHRTLFSSFSSAQISMKPTTSPSTSGGCHPTWGNYFAAAEWIRDNTESRCQNRLPQTLSHERDCQPQSHGLRLESTRPGHCRL